MVVADNTDGFNSRSNQEINQNALEFGLSTFEVISSNVDTLHFGELDNSCSGRSGLGKSEIIGTEIGTDRVMVKYNNGIYRSKGGYRKSVEPPIWV